MNFAEKIVIVTGAASGMGAASAREFRAAGAKVIIVDRNPSLAEQVGREIDADAIVIAEVFAKKSAKTPRAVLETCRRRLKGYDHAGK